MKKIVLILLFGLIPAVYAADDITVLVLNDFHGQMQANNAMVGASKISSFIRQYRLSHPNTIVVLAGDNYQGTAISNISLGAVDNDFFNQIDVKYSAIGNHDFDYGQAVFESWNANNKFEFLAANVITAGGESVVSYAKPFGQTTLASGKKIAFIGLSTLETSETTMINNIHGLEFSNPAAAANQWVKYLNSAANKLGRPDTILLLTHIPSKQESNGKIDYTLNPQLGSSEIDYITKQVAGVSAVLSAHSHLKVSGFLNGVAVVQGASQGKDISVLHYDCHSKPLCQVTPEVIDLAFATQKLPNDPIVDKIIDHYYQQNKATLNQIITQTPVALNDIPESGFYNIKLTYTIADLMRKYAKTEIGLLNSQGVRRSLPAAAISYSMLYEVMPFDNTLTTLKIKGNDLLALIEHSLPPNNTQLGIFAGVKLTLNKQGKIKKILINGQELEAKRIYTLATVNFVSDGGDGFNFKNATDLKDTNLPIRELVKQQWLKDGIKVAADWQSITVQP